MKKGDLTTEQIDTRFAELTRRIDADRLTQEQFVSVGDWSGEWVSPWLCELVGPGCTDAADYVRMPQSDAEPDPYFACGPCLQALPTE